MPTLHKRINITLEPRLERALGELAKRDSVPEATKATELIRLALELEEDELWDTLAQGRDTKKARFVGHSDAWK